MTEGFDAPSEHACPHCGASAKRQFSTPAVIFKGSGFYSTDNPKASSAGGGPSADTATSEERPPSRESGSDAKADAKADTKTETKAKD